MAHVCRKPQFLFHILGFLFHLILHFTGVIKAGHLLMHGLEVRAFDQHCRSCFGQEIGQDSTDFNKRERT